MHANSATKFQFHLGNRCRGVRGGDLGGFNMLGRTIAVIAFLAGGVLTCFVIAVLKEYGASQAGMSAGPVPAPPAAETLIPWFVGSYFVASAIGILLCRGRTAMRVAALVAHSLLLITFLATCAVCAGEPSEKFLTGLLTLSLITLVWFSPGFIIWAVFLLSEARTAQPGAAPSGGPAESLGNSEASGGRHR